MTVTTDRRELAEALARVVPLTAKFNKSGADRIRIEADGSTLSVSATNFEAGATMTMPAEGKLPPTLAVPLIARQVAALTGGTVDLAVEKGRLVVTAGGTYRSGISDAAEWPTTPDPSDGEWEPPAHLWPLLPSVATMAATDKTKKPAMMGVMFSERMMATDSYRAAMVEVGCPEPLLVPATIISTLKGVTPERITWGPRHVAFRGEWGMVWTAKIDDPFPDMAKIEPKPEAITASVVMNSELLAEVAARSTLAVGSHVPVRFELGSGSVRLHVDGDDGSFSETVEAKVEGESPVVAFNAAYLRSAIEPVDGDVRIDITTPTAPAAVSGGEHWRAVLMPVRI